MSLGSITLNIHFLSVFSVMALIFSESSIYSLLVILCAVIHEAGHIAAIKLTNAGISEISLLPFGAEIKMKNNVGYIEEFVIALSGPFINIVSGALFYIIYRIYPCPQMLFCIISSLFLALVNLIPVKGFDGGRCVRCTALYFLQYEKALKLINASELLSLILLTIFSLATIKLSGFNISLCAICIYLFVSVYSK